MQATFRSFCASSPVLAMALRLLLDLRPAKPALPAEVADPQATLLSDATLISTLKAVLSPMDMPGDVDDVQQVTSFLLYCLMMQHCPQRTGSSTDCPKGSSITLRSQLIFIYVMQLGASDSAAKFVAIHILTAPRLTAKLPLAARACLLQPTVIAHSIEALKRLAGKFMTGFHFRHQIRTKLCSGR